MALATVLHALPEANAASPLAHMCAQVRANFRPEFVNRVDEFVVFEGLTLTDIREIVRMQAKRVEQRLEDQKIHLALTEDAVDYLAVCAAT
jgi:ATP-dependent Clp protease ATP-binding subunit ClpB